MTKKIMSIRYRWVAAGSFVPLSLLAQPKVISAQSNAAPDLDARRQAILQQDQLLSEDGQLIDQDAVVRPSTTPAGQVPVRAAVAKSDSQAEVQFVRWGARYYRPGYYYGPPRARYYARYPGYYSSPYYNNFGYYGYRRGYYGRPGYYPDYYRYPYGTARVGPLRFYW